MFARHDNKVQWDLNDELVQYSDHGDLFDHQMVCYSDARYNGNGVSE